MQKIEIFKSNTKIHIQPHFNANPSTQYLSEPVPNYVTCKRYFFPFHITIELLMHLRIPLWVGQRTKKRESFDLRDQKKTTVLCKSQYNINRHLNIIMIVIFVCSVYILYNRVFVVVVTHLMLYHNINTTSEHVYFITTDRIIALYTPNQAKTTRTGVQIDRDHRTNASLSYVFLNIVVGILDVHTFDSDADRSERCAKDVCIRMNNIKTYIYWRIDVEFDCLQRDWYCKLCK